MRTVPDICKRNVEGLDFRTSKHITGNKEPESREVNKIGTQKELLYRNTRLVSDNTLPSY